jgi:hypothetical protein
VGKGPNERGMEMLRDVSSGRVIKKWSQVGREWTKKF